MRINKVFRVLEERLASLLGEVAITEIMMTEIADEVLVATFVIGFPAAKARQIEIRKSG